MLHVVGKQVGHVESNLHGVVIRLLECPCLFRNTAFYDTDNLPWVYAYIVFAQAVVWRVYVHDLPVFPALVRFPCVVQEA